MSMEVRMGNITLSFTVQGDSEGYVTFECPYCGSEFKLQAGEVQSDEEPVWELFCPYCGLAKEISTFWSKDVRDKARALAENYIIEELNKAFGKIASSINRQKSIIKMTYNPLKKVNVKELKDTDTTETEFQCPCCNRRVKALHCAGASKIFCPYCGVDL